MSIKTISLFLLVFIIGGCSTLNISTIKELEKQKFEPIELKADYDLYNLRIDIIRQSEEKKSSDSTTNKEDVAYHPIGFDLGNGIFYDLNGNLSFLIPELFKIEKNANFQIAKVYQGLFAKSKQIYRRNENKFIQEYKGVFNTSETDIIESTDTSVYMKKGAFNTLNICTLDSAILYKTGFKPRYIYKTEQGYYMKHLFGKIEITQENDTVYLSNQYIVRSYGNVIKISDYNLFKTENLLYTIIKSKNDIFVYNRNYYGLKIHKTNNEIVVYENAHKIESYLLEQKYTSSLKTNI